jgi:hypothetical protein
MKGKIREMVRGDKLIKNKRKYLIKLLYSKIFIIKDAYFRRVQLIISKELLFSGGQVVLTQKTLSNSN